MNIASPASTIRARTKRLAMDWALVLASQQIPAALQRSMDGWELIIDTGDAPRALAALKQYQIENKGWPWAANIPFSPLRFQWGAVFWVVGIAAFYWATAVQWPRLKDSGAINSDAVRHGAWWQLFTAVTLHENIPHLISNAVMGLLLLGFAMAWYGAGLALLFSYLAGVMGNLASVLIFSEPHTSLGSSGMVTGALGLVTVQSIPAWRELRSAKQFPRALAAGILILVLIGFSPGSDVIAHVGGFFAGVVLGFLLARIKPSKRHGLMSNAFAIATLAAVMAATWWLAVR